MRVTVGKWRAVFTGVACSVLLLGGTGAGQADPSPEERLGLAEQAFEQGDFQRTVDLVEPLPRRCPMAASVLPVQDAEFGAAWKNRGGS